MTLIVSPFINNRKRKFYHFFSDLCVMGNLFALLNETRHSISIFHKVIKKKQKEEYLLTISNSQIMCACGIFHFMISIE